MWSRLNKEFVKPDFGLLVLRIFLGALIFWHGFDQCLGGSDRFIGLGKAITYIGVNCCPLFWGIMAALSQLVGGVFFILGFLFRLACLFLIVTMFVATVMHYHMGHSFLGVTSRPLEMGIVYLGLFFIGPGKFSIDKE